MKPKHVKRKEAQERQEKYNELTKDQKLQKCKFKPGNCVKELAKLNKA